MTTTDIDSDVLLAAAVELAQHHWKIIPTWGKVPAIPRAHSPMVTSFNGPCVEFMSREPNPQRNCKGECGRLGHGLYDATDNVETVIRWWSGPYAGANIAARIPESMLGIDVDSLLLWAVIQDEYGPFPDCLKTISGRSDGGIHLYVRRPSGRLKTLLVPGIEIKTDGLLTQPPSIHPDTGKQYTRIDGPVPAPPEWFVDLVTDRTPPRLQRRRSSSSGSSPADRYCASVSWADVLEPYDWVCLDCDPDGEGAHWLHPDATSACSATIRNDCLFVYSTNTPFEVTEAGNPKGYTKFRAYAVLSHGGDLSAAARSITKGAAR
jgi:hypothetical protein